MKEVIYKGDKPGQPSKLRISNQIYERGKSYKVKQDTFDLLLKKGGFKEKSKKQEEF